MGEQVEEAGAGWRRLEQADGDRLGRCCPALGRGLLGTAASGVAWLWECSGFVSSHPRGLLFVFWGGEARLGLVLRALRLGFFGAFIF